jgi:hypothetical protein
MKKIPYLVALVAVVLATGCNVQSKTSVLLPTSPTPAGGSSTTAATVAAAALPTSGPLGGTWASPALPGLLPSFTNCSSLQWSISNQNETSVAGTVSAVCGGSVTVTANLTGQMSGSDVVNLTANGSAVALGITCGFNLTGVGIRQTADSLKLDYQGATCLGPVSGSEMLRRASPAAPAPTPPPVVEPQPDPEPEPDDVLFGCGSIQDNYKVVECIHWHIRPTNEHSAFEVTKRVAWALRDRGGAGLLLKPAGENIVTWRGYTFAAGRILYRDGHLIKVISDVGPGGANGPSWQDEGYLPTDRYLPALDPALP